MKVTAHQLKELDPKQFEKEYWRWTEHAADYDWWDYVEEGFREDVRPLGVQVTSIEFDLYRGWAAFSGKVHLQEWLLHRPLMDGCLPLQQALIEDRSYVVVSISRGRLFYDWYETVDYGGPLGIFADMDIDDWRSMLTDLWGDNDVTNWVEQDIQELCADLLNRLSEAYDHETSEEAFLDSCEANEVTFDYEGDEDEIQS